MTVREMQDEILRLKKQNDLCILAHAYQRREIVEIADYMGDSFGLSQIAAKSPQKTVLMCGVRFMAETVKILSPEKTVILANAQAGCPMADQIDKESVLALKREYPGAAVAAYINTTAETKTVCDVCVTSSSAVHIIGRMKEKDIIFVPDRNLGSYVADKLPEKNLILFRGGCPTHIRMSHFDIERERALHPGALLLVHPESLPAVTKLADYVGSTTGIMDFAKKSPAKEFIIGTENSIVEHLQYDCPDKRFIPLSKDTVCHNMHLTTLADVLSCVRLEGGEEIALDDETIKNARRPIDEMLRLGK